MNYYIDIYTDSDIHWLGDVPVKEKHHPTYGFYQQVKVNKKDKRRIIRKLNRRKIRYRCYEERWERSSNYRKVFFQTYHPPYRCRYCNRRLNKDYISVDHIIPVGKAKKSVKARMLLYIQGISDINDVRNLAPSCYKCNKKKDMNIGLWWIRGILGKYKMYWVVRKVFIILFLIALVLFMFQYIDIHNLFHFSNI